MKRLLLVALVVAGISANAQWKQTNPSIQDEDGKELNTDPNDLKYATFEYHHNGKILITKDINLAYGTVTTQSLEVNGVLLSEQLSGSTKKEWSTLGIAFDGDQGEINVTVLFTDGSKIQALKVESWTDEPAEDHTEDTVYKTRAEVKLTSAYKKMLSTKLVKNITAGKIVIKFSNSDAMKLKDIAVLTTDYHD